MQFDARPALNVFDADPAQDAVLISSESNQTSHTISETLLSKSLIPKQPSYFFKTLVLDVDSRAAKLNRFASLNKNRLLSTASEFIANIDFFVDFDKEYKTQQDGEFYFARKALLPSCSIHKQYGSNLIVVNSVHGSQVSQVGNTQKINLSKIYYNNTYWNLVCALVSTADSIRFDYVAYARNQSFKTKINFTFESYI